MSLAAAIASSSSAKPLTGRHRTEDLLVEQVGVVGDVGQHCRVVEVAGAVARVAADDRLRAASDRVLDELGDLAALAVVDQRPDLDAVLGAAPDLHRAHLLGELLGELVGDLLGDVEAVGGRARLADVAHLRDHRALDRGVDVGVVEHDERRVSAELHRQPQQVLRGLLHQLAADLGRAGEGQLAQPLSRRSAAPSSRPRTRR